MLEAMLSYQVHQMPMPSPLARSSSTNTLSNARTHPEALPADLPQHLRGTVNGVAVIDDGSKDLRDVEPTLELIASAVVMKHQLYMKASVLDGRQDDARTTMDATQHQDCSADRTQEHLHDQHDVERVSTSCTHAHLIRALNTQLQPQTSSISPRDAIRAGGCVIFSDVFVHEHPTSPVTQLTHEYQLIQQERARTRGKRVTATSCASSRDSTYGGRVRGEQLELVELDHYLMEAMRAERPLFRRQPSQQLYGRSTYLTRDGEGVL